MSSILGYNYSYFEHTDKVNYARNVYDGTLDRSYEYDQVGALVFAHSGAEARAAFGIDGQGWGQMDGPYSLGFDYDKYGNMIHRYGWGGEVQGGAPNGHDTDIPYTYSTNKNQRDGLGYDAAGNVTNGESFWQYWYDAVGQQVAANQPNGGGYHLGQSYDGDGLRARKDDNGTVTYYLRSTVLGGAVVAELDAIGGFSRGYFYRGDQLLAVQQNYHMYWVHEDAITKSKRTTDVYGAVQSAVELDPWGADTNRSSNSAFQPQSFTSYTRDANGDQDAMARRYSPTGRFSQPDPYSGSYDFSDPQSLNRYAYVGNDPVNRKDPSGLAMACTTPDGMSGWVGDDGKCHATVVTDTRAPIVVTPLSHRSIVGLISTRGFTGTRDHGGDPGGPNPQGSGANQADVARQFAYAFQVAKGILSQANGCSDFFGGSQSATTILGVLQSVLQIGVLPNPYTGISMSVPSPTSGNLQAGGNSYSYRTPTSATLNANGIFYHPVPIMEYISNSLAGQLAQLFHEEAHLTIGPSGRPLIPNDGFSGVVSRLNTGTVLSHCRTAINAAVANTPPLQLMYSAP